MILPLFFLFLGLTIFFLVYGWWTSSDLFRIIGIVLLFTLGMAMEPAVHSFSPLGAIEYKNGSFTDINITAVGGTTIVYSEYTPTYNTYENHLLSYFTMISAVLGFVLIMIERRRTNG